MRTRLVRRPGQPGTQAFVEQYGDRLVCIRYRYDADKKKRYKTIELIVETIDWAPKPTAETIVGVRVAANEYGIQDALRRAGGRWNRVRRLWEVPYKQVRVLGLEQRMVALD
ncbi:MAG: hypothetical protein HXY39_09315 [Chloroflexi bacterium]|nr:hypothetical protein [Chloroflexota bacterium]